MNSEFSLFAENIPLQLYIASFLVNLFYILLGVFVLIMKNTLEPI